MYIYILRNSKSQPSEAIGTIMPKHRVPALRPLYLCYYCAHEFKIGNIHQAYHRTIHEEWIWGCPWLYITLLAINNQFQSPTNLATNIAAAHFPKRWQKQLLGVKPPSWVTWTAAVGHLELKHPSSWAVIVGGEITQRWTNDELTCMISIRVYMVI